MRRMWAVIGVLALGAVAACGGEESETVASSGDPSAATTASAAPADPEQRYRFRGPVLEGGGHGPQLCANILDSLPPQCSGPDIVGWSWESVEYDEAQGTRWGEYEVVGAWNDGTFTLTAPASTHDWAVDPRRPEPLPMPCDEPSIGVREPSDAVDPDLDYFSSQPDWAGSWYVDGVLVAAFTGELDRHRDELARRIDGEFCVTAGERTYAELDRLMTTIAREYETLSVGIAVERSGIDLTVWVDDGELQSELDERYGAGVIEVSGQLEPVD